MSDTTHNPKFNSYAYFFLNMFYPSRVEIGTLRAFILPETFKYLSFFPTDMSPENIESQILQELQTIRKLLEEIDKNLNILILGTSHRMVIGERGVL